MTTTKSKAPTPAPAPQQQMYKTKLGRVGKWKWITPIFRNWTKHAPPTCVGRLDLKIENKRETRKKYKIE
jgi:hypothetical protein